MLEGGWGFVGVAYGVVWMGLILYGLSLYQRRRVAHRRIKDPTDPTDPTYQDLYP